ncbi:MAG: hypothetical protein IPK74_36680 [Deltaproteobacteria bacterium]|nr:hypothetical protein [Deltaproteobacteria bacterium]
MTPSLALDLDLLHLLATAGTDALPRERMQLLLGRELARFAAAMEGHFAHEEQVAGVANTALADEHEQLSARLGAVRDAVARASLDEARVALVEFLDAISEHERSEVVTDG